MNENSETPEPDSSPGQTGSMPDLLPARMLNEYAYCPRLFYLEWVQGEWRESHDTVEGRSKHRRTEKEAGKVPSPEDAEKDEASICRFRKILPLDSGNYCRFICLSLLCFWPFKVPRPC